MTQINDKLICQNENACLELKLFSEKIKSQIDTIETLYQKFIYFFHCRFLDHFQTILLLKNRNDSLSIGRGMSEGRALIKWVSDKKQERSELWKNYYPISAYRLFYYFGLKKNLNNIYATIITECDQFLNKKGLKAKKSSQEIDIFKHYFSTWTLEPGRNGKLEPVNISTIIKDKVKDFDAHHFSYHTLACDWLHWSPPQIERTISLNSDFYKYNTVAIHEYWYSLGFAYTAMLNSLEYLNDEFNLNIKDQIQNFVDKLATINKK
jgi:hypothetical protein